MNDFALLSLTLWKYNLCSLHFTVCHISWDSKKWKMDLNIMKNKHGWMTCTKVLASPSSNSFPQNVLAFREAPFLFFCSRKNISLATILPLALSLVKRETFSLSFFHLEGMQIWSQDDQKFSLCIFFKLYILQRKVPPLRNPYINVRKSPCPFLCLQRNNLPCHCFPFISLLKASSLYIYSAKTLLPF